MTLAARKAVVYRQKLAADPLARSRRATQAVCDIVNAWQRGGHRVLWRTGNKGAKTTDMSAAFTALAQGKRELDGRLIGENAPYRPLVLPKIRVPNVGVLGVPSYKTGYLSAIQAYQMWLGPETGLDGKRRWKAHYGPQGTVSAFLVRPDGWRDDNEKSWSRIEVYTYEGPLPEGIRADWAHPDEPPPERFWDTLTARGRLGEPYYIVLTATPKARKDWFWMPTYWDGALGTIYRGRYELKTSVFDNHALSERDRQEVVDINAGRPFEKAALYGEYVDDTGTCPFDAHGLEKWLSRCRAPSWRWDYGNGITVEVWREPEPGDEYVLIADPSSGVRDEKQQHDPSELIVGSRKRRAVSARFSGYVPASVLGELLARLGRKYNEGLAVPLVTGGYGEALILGLGDYRNVYLAEHHDSFTSNRSRIGYVETATTRGTIIEALQRAVLDDGLEVPSADMVRTLMGVQVDHLGRIAAAPGRHDESMVTLGLFAHLLETLPAVRAPRRYVAPDQDARFLRALGQRKAKHTLPVPEDW